MSIIQYKKIYIDIGDNNIFLLNNNNIFNYSEFYYNNQIKILINNFVKNIDLFNQKYFNINIIELGNYIYIYIFNKQYIINNFKININNLKNIEIYENKQIDFFRFKLNKLIIILNNKLGKDIKLPDDIIFNIKNKLNIIKNDLKNLNQQKILYYIKYLKSNFHI